MAGENRVDIPLTPVSINGPLDLGAIDVAGHADDGAMFRNDGRTTLYLHNSDDASLVVTFVTQYTREGLALADKPITIGAGKKAMVGFMTRELYNRVSEDPAWDPEVEDPIITLERVYLSAAGAGTIGDTSALNMVALVSA